MSAAPPSACTVGLQTDGPVSIVTLQRPERLNAINADLLRDLNAQLQTAQADAATRAIVLTGAGRAFCAGDDLKAFDDQSATPASRAQMCEDVQRITRTLMGGPKPVVGAVHGYAVGAGFEWLLNCDLRPHAQDGGQRAGRQALIERQKVGARIAAHQQEPGAGHLGARARLRQPAPLAPAQQPEKHQRHAKAQRQQDKGRCVVEPPAKKMAPLLQSSTNSAVGHAFMRIHLSRKHTLAPAAMVRGPRERSGCAWPRTPRNGGAAGGGADR